MMLRLLAYVLVACALIYTVHGVYATQNQSCDADRQLRKDFVFVLEGAGDNERAQLAILNRVGTPQERAELAKTFEPGLASAIARIDKTTAC